MREEYIKRQKGKCCFCNKMLSQNPAKGIREARIDKSLFPPNFFKHPVHLHHNHDTGMAIGAVHARCNAYLWEYEGE